MTKMIKLGSCYSLLHYYYLTATLLVVTVNVGVQANPTCYEYWDATCSTGVKNTYHALTGRNCTTTNNAGNNNQGDAALGTACLTTSLVALTQVDAATCVKTTWGSVQPVSECVPQGRSRRDGEERDVYLYCTADGCQDFGKTCALNEVTQPGKIKVWESCQDNVPDYYPEPLPTDGECYALPDVGASLRLSCLNNLYMQVQVYQDLACEATSPFHTAPTFLQDGYSQCYPFQGSQTDFALKVEDGCRCGTENDGIDNDNGDNSNQPPMVDDYDDNVLRFDLSYNLMVNGSNCLEGNRLFDVESRIEQTSQANVTIDIANAALHTQERLKWWYLELSLRFLAIPQPRIIEFQKNMDQALQDGSILEIFQTTCGSFNVNVTLVNFGSTVWDHESTQAPVALSSARHVGGWLGWTTTRDTWWIWLYVLTTSTIVATFLY